LRPLSLALSAALLTLAVSACGETKEETGDETTASETSTPLPKESSDPVEDFPELTPFSAELQKTLHDIRAKVAEIRGLPVHPTAQEGLVSREALAAYGRDQFSSLEEEDAADIAASEAVLTLMGLIPPGYTFETFVEEKSNVTAGVYYFEADRLVLVGENPDKLSMSEELTIAHEYTHSLQDGKYDLDVFFDKWTESVQEEEGYTSYSETLRCLIEGDAELTQRLYAEDVYGDDWEELEEEESADDEPIEFDIPDFLLRSFAFYYGDCVRFVEALYEEGGWAAVNAAYEDPPGTTEQIIDVEKYKAREWADEPKPEDLEEELVGWSEVDGGQWGQYDTYNYIASRTDDYSLGAEVSYGWSSGWIRFFRDDSNAGRIAVEVKLAWDEDFGAYFFALFFSDVLQSHGVSDDEVSTTGDVRRWVTSDGSNQHGAIVASDSESTVRLIFASDEAALDTLLSVE
jgi:hypothetical protein